MCVLHQSTVCLLCFFSRKFTRCKIHTLNFKRLQGEVLPFHGYTNCLHIEWNTCVHSAHIRSLHFKKRQRRCCFSSLLIPFNYGAYNNCVNNKLYAIHFRIYTPQLPPSSPRPPPPPPSLQPQRQPTNTKMMVMMLPHPHAFTYILQYLKESCIFHHYHYQFICKVIM